LLRWIKVPLIWAQNSFGITLIFFKAILSLSKKEWITSWRSERFRGWPRCCLA
jgi:hypothetical protein